MCVDRAEVALDDCCKALFDLSVKPPTLCISGVDHFQNAVVFAKVQADEEFDRLHVIASMLFTLITFVVKPNISSVLKRKYFSSAWRYTGQYGYLFLQL